MKAQLLVTRLCFFMFALVTSAQTALPPPSQELFPMESGITCHTPEYTLKLRALLFENKESGGHVPGGVQAEELFQFLRLPPFTPETLLTVSRRGANYVATVISPLRQIWSFDGDIANLDVSRKEKQLPVSIAQRADRLWLEMLARARFAESGIYPDAEGYCFFKWVKGCGTLAGETYPRKNTRPAMLAGIARGLVEFVSADAKSEAAILTRLDTQIGALENELGLKKLK